MGTRLRGLAAFIGCVTVVGCGGESEFTDAAPGDGRPAADASVVDAAPDAATPDAAPDAATPDAAAPDAATPDAAAPDAAPDAATPDAAAPDAAVPDAMPAPDAMPNVAPVAAATAQPGSGCAPATIQLGGTGSTDSDGTIVGYAWDLGDGGTATTATVSHAYAPGTFTATLTVTDDRGGTDVDTVQITVHDPASGVKTWLGLDAAQPTRWNVAANWCPAGVPGLTDDVLIPALAPVDPVLSATQGARDLTIEIGAQIDLAGNNLIADGSVVAAGPLVGAGNLDMRGSGVTVRGLLRGLRIQPGTASVSLSGPTTVGAALQADGVLTLAGHPMTVAGNASINGPMVMNNAADDLVVGGNLNFNLLTAPDLSAGVIHARGGLFSCAVNGPTRLSTGTHTFALDGAVPLTLSLNSAACRLQHLVFGNVAGVLMTASIRVDGTTTMQQGVLTAQAGSQTAHLSGDLVDSVGDRFMPGRIFLEADVALPERIATDVFFNVPVNLDHDVRIDGDVRVDSPSGDIFFHGHALHVTGQFRTSGNGYIHMVNAADTLIVDGDALFEGLGGLATGPTDYLTGGTLHVRGRMNCFLDQQAAVRRYFHAGIAHTLVLDGLADQQLDMLGNDCRLGSVILKPAGASGAVALTTSATLLGDLEIYGDVTVPAATALRVGLSLFLSGATVTNGGTVCFGTMFQNAGGSVVGNPIAACP